VQVTAPLPGARPRPRRGGRKPDSRSDQPGTIGRCEYLVYLVVRALVRLLVGGGRPHRDGGAKDLEILVLRHQLRVLHRTAGRPQLRTVDRVLLATASRAIPRDRWVAFLVTPSTLLRWHRELVKLLGRKTRPCTQVGEVTFDGARPDAPRDQPHPVRSRQRRRRRPARPSDAGSRAARVRRAGIRLSCPMPRSRGEPLIAALDGHAIGCNRVADTCRARQMPDCPAGALPRRVATAVVSVPAVRARPMPAGFYALRGRSGRPPSVDKQRW
jgi:hypothetical protein